MADLLNDYYKKLQTLNQQRSMTGNQSYNQGIDASLAEGYFNTQEKNKQAEQQYDLQKQQLALQQQGQAWNQDFATKQLANQQSSQTTNLFGQAIGAGANLMMMNKYINNMGSGSGMNATQAYNQGGYGQGTPWKPMADTEKSQYVNPVSTNAPNALDTANDFNSSGNLINASPDTSLNFDWGSDYKTFDFLDNIGMLSF